MPRRGQPDHDARQCAGNRVAHDQHPQVARTGAEGDPKAEFGPSQFDDPGDQPVEPEAAQDDRQHADDRRRRPAGFDGKEIETQVIAAGARKESLHTGSDAIERPLDVGQQHPWVAVRARN